MDKTEFTKKLIEKIVFEELKDKFEINTMSGLRWYLKELNIIDRVDARRLYINLTNYRIEKFGNSIVFQDFSRDKGFIVNDYDDKFRRAR